MSNPWLGIFLVSGILALLFVVLHWMQQRLPYAELSRKLLHISMGIVTLGFPWLFQQVWPVWLLAGTSIVGMLVLKTHKGLRAHLGKVVHSIKRESYGELYYPLAVAILFHLAHDNPLLYCIPILILALADAVAALVGVRYGKTFYTAADGFKTLEGSVAFLIVAFFSIALPLLYFTELSWLQVFDIALLTSLLVMLLEAIAWRGLDNLLIPLGSYMTLGAYMQMGPLDLSFRLALLLAIAVFITYWKKRSTLNDSGSLGAVLVGYLCWTAGGWRWLLPPLMLFVLYSLMELRTGAHRPDEHSIFAVVSVSAVSMMWLFSGTNHLHLFCFALAFAAQLTLIGIARMKFHKPQRSNYTVLTASIGQGTLLLLFTYFLIPPYSSAWILELACAVCGMLVSALIFITLQPPLHARQTDAARWWRQGMIGGGASLFGFIPNWIAA